MYFPALYNWIVDIFEDPEDDDAEKSMKELLQWWNQYVQVYYPDSLLILSHWFRKVFPPAAAGKGSMKDSRKAMQESRKRFREARERRARREASARASTRHSSEGSITEDDSGAEYAA